jgi:hypothetical protein
VVSNEWERSPNYPPPRGAVPIARRPIMDIVCKTATDSRFKVVGMCAPDSSHGSGAVSLTCTTTEETWECSTSSSKVNMLAKPTAPGLWEAAKVEWEARAMRQHDEQQAKIAREQGLPVRARIQNEARAARRRRSTEIRASEQARQWDLQRPDIHTALVSERLAEVQAEITQVVTLADPVPDAEPDRPVRVLPVRYVQREEQRS